jgi:hypothetical protein
MLGPVARRARSRCEARDRGRRPARHGGESSDVGSCCGTIALLGIAGGAGRSRGRHKAVTRAAGLTPRRPLSICPRASSYPSQGSTREAYLSAKPPRAQTAARFPFAHGNRRRPQGHRCAPVAWPQAPLGLTPQRRPLPARNGFGCGADQSFSRPRAAFAAPRRLWWCRHAAVPATRMSRASASRSRAKSAAPWCGTGFAAGCARRFEACPPRPSSRGGTTSWSRAAPHRHARSIN